jgi:hypothetical protein
MMSVVGCVLSGFLDCEHSLAWVKICLDFGIEKVNCSQCATILHKRNQKKN